MHAAVHTALATLKRVCQRNFTVLRRLPTRGSGLQRRCRAESPNSQPWFTGFLVPVGHCAKCIYRLVQQPQYAGSFLQGPNGLRCPSQKQTINT